VLGLAHVLDQVSDRPPRGCRHGGVRSGRGGGFRQTSGVFDDHSPGMFRVQLGHWIVLTVGSLCCDRLGVPVELIGDLWIGGSGDLLITS
jgi:hypothetical protein